MTRVHSFAMAFNYNILNYPLTYICPVLTALFECNFIILSITSNNDIYSQVQSFQINDYANHYVDIEITGFRVLYNEIITGRRQEHS